MGCRTLQITIQYAEDLSKVNFISKMDVYIVVSISGGGEHSIQKTKTTVNHDDDANPSWSFPMKFTVEEAALLQNRLILDFKIKCQRALGDRLIGEVHVPIKDLLLSQPKSRGAAAATESFVSYQVTKPSGKPKGRLTFSYQFHENNWKTATSVVSPPPPPAAAAAAKPVHGKSTIAYPEVEPSSPYQPISLGGYPSIRLEPAVAPPPPAVEEVYGETMTAKTMVEPTSLYPPIPPPLGYVSGSGLELKWHPPPPPPPPPRPCCVYPPPMMQLAPDWWIADWRYDTRCSGF